MHEPKVSNQTRALLCLALEHTDARPLGEVRTAAINAGWPGAKTVNLSDYLGRAKGLAIKTPDGWKLTPGGRDFIEAQAKKTKSAVPTSLTKSLRAQLSKISSADTRDFVEEAIECAERGLWRSAVVLSWVGALAVLYDFVHKNKLPELNAEAARRNAKWKPATSVDDLARLEEYEFLQILAAISVIGKNVKTELEGCLKLRNGCGHPNSLKVADAKVAAHLETLLLNVFAKF